MADRGDTHYHVPSLNKWFLFSAAFFTLTMVWTVIDDWNAEWKQYQREFRELDLQNAEDQLDELGAAGVLEREADLMTAVEAAEAEIAQEEDRIEELEDAAYEASELLSKRDMVKKKTSEDFKWAIYKLENRRTLDPDGDHSALEADVEALRTTLGEQSLEVEELTLAEKEAKDTLAAAKKTLLDAQNALAAATFDLGRVREKIEGIDPSAAPEKVANLIRDFPGLDFIGPNMKVQKQVLDGITMELNFTKKPRIDMCTTCHVGADRVGFEEAPQPHTTHPRLDLFLTSKSPHPFNQVGCTVCHRGSGESLDFQHTDHRPDDEAEQEAWEEEYHWHKQHHWDYPMLKSQHTEASCIQCHKTSMELIAEDAPKLTEGYRLVERYGCYACHKIDWFPTERRPGPSLLQMRAKLTPDWTESWIARPRSYRPSTWMPQIFHLSNYPANEVVVVSEYDQGREIMGQEWNDNAVAAITAYLFENHADVQPEPLPGDILVTDAERGRELMNVVGCYACHNVAPHEGEDAGLGILAETVGRYNDKGPNLRGVATKLNREWLYNWLMDPAKYWADTNMPNLRLTPQDAADITAYMTEDPDGIFHDVPEGWTPESKPMQLDVLQEQARWFFQKEGRAALERRFNGEDPEHLWNDPAVLAPAVGQAHVAHQGCFSCHEIEGMQSMMPIGAELSNWGTKTVDKLDFGLSYRRNLTLPASVMGEPKLLPELGHEYREGWLARKLHHPRSFDIEKEKNPKEKLRMPWFDFSEDQIDAITTFVIGLVDDEVPGAKMEPTTEQLAMDAGMRAVRQNNCVSCHVINPGEVTYMTEDAEGERRQITVQGNLVPFPDEILPPKMRDLETLRAAKADWESYAEEELEEVIVTLWNQHPDAGASSETVIIPFEDLVAISAPEGGDFVDHITSYYLYGTLVANPDYDPSVTDEDDPAHYKTNPWSFGFDEDSGLGKVEEANGTTTSYWEEEYSKVRWTFAPPVLLNEGFKIQRDWFFAFLQEPYALRQQMRVKMPSFHYKDGEAESIADYFLAKTRKEWPSRFARTLRLMLGREALPEKLAQPSWDGVDQTMWPAGNFVTDSSLGVTAETMAELMAEDRTNLSPAAIRLIEAGYQPEIAANFSKLHDWAIEQGFDMTWLPSFSYERIVRQSPSHLREFGARIPFGEAIATSEAGINCYQCHPRVDGTFAQDPIAWAPALENAKHRLREEWVREWLWSPKTIYPGTAMPENFSASGDTQYPDLYPDASNRLQLESVMDWLYNLGGAPPITQVAQGGGGGLDLESLTVAQLEDLVRRKEAAAAEAAAAEEAARQAAEEAAEAPSEEPEGGGEQAAETAPTTEPAADPPPVTAPLPTGAGVVVGRVVFEGEAPTPKPLTIKEEQAKGCCEPGVSVDDTDRSLLIGPGGGIENVVLTITVAGSELEVSPDPVVLDQVKCRYEPHVMVVPVGTNIHYTNSDSISHNVHTYATRNAGVNQTVAAGKFIEQQLTQPEPIRSACDIHPWMESYVFVTDATHHAISGPDGTFAITGLPPGDYKIELWHEKLGKSKADVTVPATGAAEPLEIKLSAGGGGGRRRR